MFRKTIFWLHLICGVVAGIVILMMSVTGVILTYERQMQAWEDRVYFTAPAGNEERLAVSQLLERATEPGEFEPTSFMYHNQASSPAVIRAGRAGTKYLNPYSGEVLTPHEDSLSRFFATVRGWHRWFNQSGDERATARMITGASNLMFFFLVLSGIYLWLPAIYNWGTMRLRLWFHPNAKTGNARDFNWHHVFGFWAAIPLAIIVATATVFYYSWANNLVYRLAGEEPPQRGASSNVVREAPRPTGVDAMAFDALFDRAASEAGEWNTLTLTVPAPDASVVSFAIDQGTGGEPQKRHNIHLSRFTGEVVEWAPFTSLSPGRQARSWVRFLHTGEALGLFGQTVAGIASFAAVLMVWTGLSLALYRFRRWLKRQKKAADTIPLEEVA